MPTTYRISPSENLRHAIWEFLQSPFRRNLPLFAALLVLQCIEAYVYVSLCNSPSIGMATGTLAWAYFLALPQGFFSKRICRGIYMAFTLSISAAAALMDLFVADTFKEPLFTSHIVAIVESNTAEAKEFVDIYFSWKFVLHILTTGLLACGAYWACKPLTKRGGLRKGAVIMTILCIMSCGASVFKGVWGRYGTGQMISAFIGLKDHITVGDLNVTQLPYSMYETATDHPAEIVFILGEAHDKNHSSLYSYDKTTNPLLAKRLKRGEILVFDSVYSPAPYTFRAMVMALSLSEEENDPDWAKRPILPTAMRKAGYNTFIISNSSLATYGENLETKIIHTFDHFTHTGREGKILNPFLLDETVLPILADNLKKEKCDTSSRRFHMIHLIGSHNSYNERYPRSFARFKSSDYNDRPQNQRSVLAAYDNSLLYNDFIVDSIMEAFSGRDAIVIYTPDHGEDVFHTDAVYAGHYRQSKGGGGEIPLIIFMTSEFRDRHPQMEKSLRDATSKRFDTRYIMNTILSIAGYGINGHDTRRHSLLKNR